MAQYDDLDTSMIGVIGVISALGAFVLIVGLQVLYFQYEATAIRPEISVTSPEIESRVAQQKEKLASYEVLDTQSGRVQIPIEAAMELVVREYAEKTSNDGN